MEQTLVMIKPDCVRRRMVGLVISALETRNLDITGIVQTNLSVETASDLYREHRGKWHFERNIKHVTSGPVVLLQIEGTEAVKICREFVEHFRLAHREVISRPKNLVHASDSVAKAQEELLSVGFNSSGYAIAI